MKKILYIAFTTLLISCGTQKIVSFEYNVVTRGYKQTIKVSRKTTEIVQNNSRNANAIKRELIETEPNIWKALQKASKNIKLNEINSLESPTNKRQYDGAMFAKLTLTTADSTFKSAGFDHGHPPVMIKTVVDSLVNLGVSE